VGAIAVNEKEIRTAIKIIHPAAGFAIYAMN